ncbi:MAG TPA: ASCH domain-containing protein [Polyangiales bacterium]|nr:ASCH domain-containing protein [Polyangiales bacterium]
MDERADAYFVPKDARVQAFWRAFCRSAELSNDTDYQAWHFGDTRELADALIDLVVHGQKRATAALGYLYDRNPSLEPVLYGYSVLTEFEGAPRAVIQTIHIERRAFRDVDAAFARIEGEGDGSLRYWREAHWDYFGRECRTLGLTPSEDMLVVLERFALLYPPT